MGWFGKRRAPAEWHGRSVEIADGGTLAWAALWDALAAPLDPPAPGAMAPIGLRGVSVGGRGDPTATYHGIRHGRWVQIREEWSAGRGLDMIVWVGAASSPCAIEGRDGRLVVTAGPADVAQWVSTLAPSAVWDGVQCRGSAGGVVTRRRVSSRQPQGWMYDLWLAERLATIGALPAVVAPDGDPAGWIVPA